MATRRASTPRFFANAAEFRSWLDSHASATAELWVGFHKVATGKPSLTWPESVDEALCHGWIDGVRRRLDETAYEIRFTPRKPASVWSAVNMARVAELTTLGRMRPGGLAAFAKRIEHKSGIYAYEQSGALALAPAELRLFEQNKAAWTFFEATAPSYRKTMTYWIVSAKRADTRARRLAKLMDACAAGQRLLP